MRSVRITPESSLCRFLYLHEAFLMNLWDNRSVTLSPDDQELVVVHRGKGKPYGYGSLDILMGRSKLGSLEEVFLEETVVDDKC